jgi:hypothetical protein
MLLSSEQIARIRQQYADGVAVAAIRAGHGVSQATLYMCLGGKVPGQPPLPPIPRRQERKTSRPAAPPDRRSLVARLWNAAGRQVAEIEQRLGRDRPAAGERESDARMLAMLVKTLRELSALDEAHADSGAHNGTDPEDDDAVPRDIDEFRSELARRIEAFVRSRTAPGIPGAGEE